MAKTVTAKKRLGQHFLVDLTVAQNMFIGREFVKGGFINDRAMEAEARRQFEKMGVKIDPSEKLGNLTVGKQQMVEITKAISRDCKLLVLDEPTAALTLPEVEELFKIMGELKEKGIGMIYISHRMDEINRISDRVTVMRDGEYVGTVNTAAGFPFLAICGDLHEKGIVSVFTFGPDFSFMGSTLPLWGRCQSAGLTERAKPSP